MKLRLRDPSALAYIILAAVIVSASSAAATVIAQQTMAQTIPELPVDRDISIYFKTFCISVIVVTWCF